jgi:hypothetical protein
LHELPVQEPKHMAEHSENEGRALTYSFNPYQRQENCFYVALGRLLSIDSVTVATWTGNKEIETDTVGMTVTGSSAQNQMSFIMGS